MVMEKINIWEIGERINVKVSISFTDLINNKIEKKFGTKRLVHKQLIKDYSIPFSTFKSRMKRGYKYFVELDILLNLCNLLEIPLEILQKNIVAYKARRGHNYIEKPKLPIEITPIFDMLIAHHISDGNVVNPFGRKPYFAYRQFDKEYRDLYVKKIESVFGVLNYENKYFDNKDTTRIYFPVAAAALMFKVYDLGVDDFKSELARIPVNLLNKDWKHQLAFLIGVIIDEGTVDSSLISIRMKNKGFVGDLGKICVNLGYDFSFSHEKNGLFGLYILSKDLNKFYANYLELLKEYPEINLGHKGEKIKAFVTRINKPKVYI
ncbi:MAG: hypothetical protein Q8O89_01250, partial [Nanoarchaeota archaeon]|nr:hypothetical protein [Nanoarchaeota archaeon]